jgi:hypothetical protein
MTKTYQKKENLFLWYFILILCIGLLIFGWLLVKYFVWQAFMPIGIAVSKIITLGKKPTLDIIELNNEGIKTLSASNTSFYAYTNIESIHMNSKALNGHLRLKDSKKKNYSRFCCYIF